MVPYGNTAFILFRHPCSSTTHIETLHTHIFSIDLGERLLVIISFDKKKTAICFHWFLERYQAKMFKPDVMLPVKPGLVLYTQRVQYI